MLRGKRRQRFGQIMSLGLMGQVNHANLALMILAQSLAQHAPQGAQAGTGSQQPQWPRLPVRIIVQRSTPQFAQP